MLENMPAVPKPMPKFVGENKQRGLWVIMGEKKLRWNCPQGHACVVLRMDTVNALLRYANRENLNNAIHNGKFVLHTGLWRILDVEIVNRALLPLFTDSKKNQNPAKRTSFL